MAAWKSVALQAGMNVTRLITPKSIAVPGRATNLIQWRHFTNGSDHQGPPKEKFLGKDDAKDIIILGLFILNHYFMHSMYELYKEKEKYKEKVELSL